MVHHIEGEENVEPPSLFLVLVKKEVVAKDDVGNKTERRCTKQGGRQTKSNLLLGRFDFFSQT